jgi:hypothetical protein
MGSAPRSSGEARRGDDGQRTVRSVDENTVQTSLPARCAGGADGCDRRPHITAAEFGASLESGRHVRWIGRFPMSRGIRVRRRSKRQLRSRHRRRGLLRNLPPIDYNPCAAILCIEGTTCCPQCGGICIPNDIPCSEDLCVSEPCNQVMCGPGEYCCNESCSQCAGLGQVCTDEYCPPQPPSGEPCGPSFCGAGEYCCNESCGICAPLGGGCIEVFCEPPGQVGVPCGPTICAPGQVCCNESCGICTPPDGVCIMIACVD